MKGVGALRGYARRTPVFDASSVVRLIGDAAYAHLLLSQLASRGEIRRLTRGYYTVHDDPSLLVYCLKPSYLGLQDAMSFHNLWEQETNPIIITSRKVRPGRRKVLGSNVIVRRIAARHFFGFDYHRQGELIFPVSDIDKTFIDLIYFNEMNAGMAKDFRGKLDRKRLMEYMSRYDKRLARRVIGMAR